MTLTYSLRLSNGQPISEDQAAANWRSMWVGTGCILQLPVTPDTPGSYVIDLYLDGQIVSSLAFTVVYFPDLPQRAGLFSIFLHFTSCIIPPPVV